MTKGETMSEIETLITAPGLVHPPEVRFAYWLAKMIAELPDDDITHVMIDTNDGMWSDTFMVDMDGTRFVVTTARIVESEGEQAVTVASA